MSAENFSIKSVKGISVCDTNVFIGDPLLIPKRRQKIKTVPCEKWKVEYTKKHCL